MDGNSRVVALAIHDLAVQFARPSSEVHEILQIQICRLNQQARIKQYVSLLAIKRVKDLLRTNQRTDQRYSTPTRQTRFVV